MGITVRFYLMVALVALVVLFSGPAAAQEADALWERLAAGGLVVMVRHTDAEGGDPERSLHLTDPKACSEEANLTEQGRNEARSLKAALAAHDVPVDGVLVGAFCRTLQTADEAFGGGERWHALNLLDAMDPMDADFLMEDVRDRMSDFSGEGNLFMVTHRPNINTLTFHNPEPGDLVLLEVDAFGRIEVVGVLTLADYHSG